MIFKSKTLLQAFVMISSLFLGSVQAMHAAAGEESVKQECPTLQEFALQACEKTYFPVLDGWSTTGKIDEHIIKLKTNIGRAPILEHAIVKYKDEDGNGYLHKAARHNNVPAVQYFVDLINQHAIDLGD